MPNVYSSSSSSESITDDSISDSGATELMAAAVEEITRDAEVDPVDVL